MNENGKADALSAHENAHEQTQRFLKELRGLLADVSEFLSDEHLQPWGESAKIIADRAESMLTQVVAYGHELEEDRRDLAALLKAAHEVIDDYVERPPYTIRLEHLNALQAATLPYQDRVDLFTEPEEIFHPKNIATMHPVDALKACGVEFTPEQETAHRAICDAPAFIASSSTVAEDLENDLAEVITDSVNGPDWTSRHAAKAVVDYLTARNHPAATPGTVTPAVAIHRLSVMARVAEQGGRLGDVQSCRDAMRIIGELQSHVTRLTAPEVAYIRDPENGNAPPAIVELGQWARHPGIDERLRVVSISWGSDQTPSCEAVGEESGLRMTLPLANMRADTLPLDGQ